MFVTLPVNFAAVDVEPPVLTLATALEVGKEPAPQCMYLAVPEAAVWVTASTYLTPPSAVVLAPKLTEPFGVIETLPEAAVPVNVEVTVPDGV